MLRSIVEIPYSASVFNPRRFPRLHDHDAPSMAEIFRTSWLHSQEWRHPFLPIIHRYYLNQNQECLRGLLLKQTCAHMTEDGMVTSHTCVPMVCIVEGTNLIESFLEENGVSPHGNVLGYGNFIDIFLQWYVDEKYT